MSLVNYEDFGLRVRAIRRQQDITQEQLASRIGISSSFMGHIERGTRVASLETLIAICNALNQSPSFLLQSSLDPIQLNFSEDTSEDDRNLARALISFAINLLELKKAEEP